MSAHTSPAAVVPRIRRKESGAVLYVALIMLILLALIGVIGMQVAGMQERMSANYRAVNLAFQNAEGAAREAECGLEDLVNRTTTAGCTIPTVNQVCDDGFDPSAETESLTVTTDEWINARLIGPCISGNANIGMGAPVSEDPNPVYQVTVHRVDDDDNPTAATAIDTIFRP